MQNRTYPKGRPGAAEVVPYDISGRFSALRETLGEFADLLYPPSSLIRKFVFEKWLSGETRRPRKVQFEQYMQFLNETYPLANQGWDAFFDNSISNPDQFFAEITRLRDGKKWQKDSTRSAKSSLTGFYQIVRPYVSSNQEKFILEPMQIEMLNDGKYGIYSYSHNQRAPNFVYSGIAEDSSLYIFTQLTRKHETAPNKFAVRFVAIFAPDRRLSAFSERSRCLSGVMIRGNRALAMGKVLVAIPFVAIPVSIDLEGNQPSLKHADFVTFDPPLSNRVILDFQGLFINNTLLIGEIDNEFGDIFTLCKMIGNNILSKSVNEKDPSIYTIAPDQMERSISKLSDEFCTPRKIDRQTLPELWSHVVASELQARREKSKGPQFQSEIKS